MIVALDSYPTGVRKNQGLSRNCVSAGGIREWDTQSFSRWPAGSEQGAFKLVSGYLSLFSAPWVELCEKMVGKGGSSF